MKIVLAFILLLAPAYLAAGGTPTVCQNELSSWIKSGKKLSIVDIQSPEGFRAHNYAHSIATGNDPLKLKKVAGSVRSGSGTVVVVSAAGGDDAAGAADRLARWGVKRSRIVLLEGGMEAAAKNASCDCCKPAALPGENK